MLIVLNCSVLIGWKDPIRLVLHHNDEAEEEPPIKRNHVTRRGRQRFSLMMYVKLTADQLCVGIVKPWIGERKRGGGDSQEKMKRGKKRSVVGKDVAVETSGVLGLEQIWVEWWFLWRSEQ